LLVALFVYSGCLYAQMATDSAAHRHDSVYTIRKNVPNSKLWGNAWYFAAAFNWCRINEFDINIGRTYGVESCSGGGCVFTMRSWGAGYGIFNNNGNRSQLAKAFWEYSLFYYPPISASIRAEYMYDLTNRSHYIRPAAGLSLMVIDVLYNYSFNLSGTPNPFKHGLTFRLKHFQGKKKFQRNSLSRC
jgi:hypothetical protein